MDIWLTEVENIIINLPLGYICIAPSWKNLETTELN